MFSKSKKNTIERPTAYLVILFIKFENFAKKKQQIMLSLINQTVLYLYCY